MNGWYITSDGMRYELETTNDISLTGMDLIELVIPDQVIHIGCGSNHLTELILPNGVKDVYCSNNKLTKLELPDSVTYIYCKNNKLTELIVPDNCIVTCDESCKVITRTMYNRSNRLKAILK